ncbi:MAG: type I restriction-modification system subunit M [Candidatus Thiodiazotropha lotti]|nr:type I restriction-modification system subunit M [Candidatus Thiodiazotropha lotti]MCW4187857.1 type I restriction-modification system subunit M [Candidatus Thiodiazotropha lotti]
MTPANFQQLSNFIWSVADLLRGPYRPPQYERVMLPLTVLRRFDAVLALTKKSVLVEYEKHKHKDSQLIDKLLNNRAKDDDGNPLGFHNHSALDFQALKGDPDNVGRHLTDYINGFSENVRKIFEYFEFEKEIEKMEEANRLYLVVSKFAEIDLHPKVVDNITMGLVFEDLIRRFNEAANETAGDHFTPREVIRLMVNLLLEPDSHVLTQEGIIVTVCDPACGTGGMLSETQNWIRAHNDSATVRVFGQDYNPRSYAVSASDLLIKGFKDSRVEYGNTLIDDKFDKHPENRFDYLLANPPFGVDWKAEQKVINRWPNFRGYSGKLPRVNDGALLFLIHMIAKFQPYEEGNRDKPGTRVAIVFNGSPLFTGGAGSGESEIRRWIIEHDWLEAIIALPEQMFYNTGIGTYIWVVSNRKSAERRGRIQLLDARDRWTPMKRSLGDKRRYLNEEAVDTVTREHGTFELSETSKLFDNADFGYRRITVQRPLRLRFQMTQEAKEQFLDACPELLDAVLEMQEAFGPDPHSDWYEIWAEAQRIVKESDSDWLKGAKGTAQKKLFRDCFTETDPDAEPVIAKHGKRARAVHWADLPNQTLPAGMNIDDLDPLFGVYPEKGDKKQIEYEPDPKLKDFENIPLKEDIISYFLREVQPYVADAWIDRKARDEQDGGIGKVGYEINFNREFFKYQPPRLLADIDAELEAVESRIMGMLREVTE